MCTREGAILADLPFPWQYSDQQTKEATGDQLPKQISSMQWLSWSRCCLGPGPKYHPHIIFLSFSPPLLQETSTGQGDYSWSLQPSEGLLKPPKGLKTLLPVFSKNWN